MKNIAIFIAIIFVFLFVQLVFAAPKINFAKTEFQFGDEIYFNMGDNYCYLPSLEKMYKSGKTEEQLCYDKNGFFFPHILESQLMMRGRFIKCGIYEADGGVEFETCTVYYEYIDSETRALQKEILERRVVIKNPTQSVIIFNW